MRRAFGRSLGPSLHVWRCRSCRNASTYSASDARRLLEALKRPGQDTGHKVLRKVDVIKNGGLDLLKLHGFSLRRLLASTHAGEELADLDVCEKLPQGIWDSVAVRQAFLDSFEQDNGIRCLADWAGVRRGTIEAHAGPGLLRRRSKAQLLRERYPNASEEDVHTVTGRRHSWRDAGSRRAFLESLAQELQIEKPEDWKKVKSADIIKRGGSRLLAVYGGSLAAALQDAFPDTLGAMDEDCFRPSRRQGYWKEEDNQRALLRRILDEEGLEESPHGWRQLSAAAVVRRGGGAVLAMHNGSLSSTLLHLFPESQVGEDGELARMPMPRGHFESRRNQRQFLVDVAAMHGFDADDLTAWSRVTRASILRHPWGSSFLRRFSSIYEALETLFPEHSGKWNVFDHRPVAHRSYWASDDNVAAFLQRVKESLQITTDDEWARVSVSQIRELGGAGMLSRMSLAEALPIAYPTKEWSQEHPVKPKRAVQRHLHMSLKQLFSDALPIQSTC